MVDIRGVRIMIFAFEVNNDFVPIVANGSEYFRSKANVWRVPIKKTEISNFSTN